MENEAISLRFGDLEDEVWKNDGTNFPMSKWYDVEHHEGLTKEELFFDYLKAVFNFHLSGIVDADFCNGLTNPIDDDQYSEIMEKLYVAGISPELVKMYEGKTKHFDAFLSAYGID